MANEPIYSMTDTWSQAGTKHDAIKMNVTDAASTADSTLINLQVGGNSKIVGVKDGSLILAGTLRPIQAAIASLPSAETAGAGAIAYATGEGGGLVVSDGTAWKQLEISSGDAILPVARGGTGASSPADARTNLGIGSIATRNLTVSPADPSGGADGDVWFKV